MRRMHGKKGIGRWIYTGVGFFFAVLAFLVMKDPASSNAQDNFLGKTALDITRAHYDMERPLLFIDYSAKYALQKSIVRLGDKGGVYGGMFEGNDETPPCGNYLFPVWTPGEPCKPSTSSLFQVYDEELQAYLKQYPEFPLPSDNYDYSLKSGKGTIILYGFARSAITVPVGDKVAQATTASPISSSTNPSGNTLQCPSGICGGVLAQKYGASESEVNSQLVRINLLGKSVRVHMKAKAAFEQANADSMKCPELSRYPIKDIGTFNWRCMRGFEGDAPGTCKSENGIPKISYHSFGIAVDINVDENKYCKPAPARACKDDSGRPFSTDIPQCVVDSFKKNNFVWGGDWNDPVDPMHFEWHGDPDAAAGDSATSAIVPAVVDGNAVNGIDPAVQAKVLSYQDAIADSAAKFSDARLTIDQNLIKAVITQESGGDAQAGSVAGAQGLMQIMPDLHYDECVKQCGFTSKADFKDGPKNICCGTYILKTLYLKKPKKYPDPQYTNKNYYKDGECCVMIGNKESCGGKEYAEWEAALRGYNGWGCGQHADPEYVERVMKYYAAWGGVKLDPGQAFSGYSGSYQIMPNFKAVMAYNFSLYADLHAFATGEIAAKYDGSDPEKYLDAKGDEFMKLHPEVILVRQCADYPIFYDIAEQLYDCAVQEEFACTCTIKISGLVLKDYDIAMYGQELRLLKYDGEDVGLSLPLPFLKDEFLRYSGDTPLSLVGLELRIRQDNGVFKNAEMHVYNKHGISVDGGYLGDLGGKSFLMYRSKDAIELTKRTDQNDLPACQEKKHYYALCAEQVNEKVQVVENGKLAEKPVRIRFAVDLTQQASVLPPVEPPPSPP